MKGSMILVLFVATLASSARTSEEQPGLASYTPPVSALAVDSLDPENVYVGTEQGWVFRSTNAGRSWRVARLGKVGGSGSARPVIRSLAVDTLDPKIVYAGSLDGVFKTMDGGRSWRRLHLGGFVLGVASLALAPRNPQIVYACGRARAYRSAVLRSMDGGQSWQWFNGLSCDQVTVGPGNSKTVYAHIWQGVSGIDQGGVVKSTDAGRTWRPLKAEVRRTDYIVVDPRRPSTLYIAATTHVGTSFFKTSDGGEHWAALSLVDHTWDVGSTAAIDPLAIDPRKPNTLYAGIYNKAYKSTDGGQTWRNTSTGLGPRSGLDTPVIKVLLVAPGRPGVVYAGTEFGGGVFKSTDGGQSWHSANNGLRQR